MIFRHLLNMRSHPTWVRGLKQECFCIARHTRFLGEIAAILILGAQRSELRVKPAQRGVFSRLRALFSRRRTQKEQLTDEILLNLSPKKLFEVITQVLTTLELSDFSVLPLS